MDWMFAPFQLFIRMPLLALIPTLLFALLWRAKRTRSALVAAILWGLYTIWELGISQGILCGQDCDIRVDLLLISPVLLVASLIGIVQSIRRR